MIVTQGQFKGKEAKEVPTSHLRELLKVLPFDGDLTQEIRFIILERIMLYQTPEPTTTNG